MKLGLFVSLTLGALSVVLDASASPLFDLTGGTDGIGGLPTPASPDGFDHYPALVADEVPDDSEVAGEPFAGSRGLQTNNPGWPGFGSQGAIVSGGVYLTVMP